jgi:hypothetical protein
LRLTIVAATVGGGFAGFMVTFQVLCDSSHSLANSILLVFFALLYLFVTAAGLMFVHDPASTRLVSIALAMQTVWISSPLIVYNFSAGFRAVLELGVVSHQPGQWSALINYDVIIGSGFKFRWLQDNPWYLGLNFFLFVLLLLLGRSSASNPTLPPQSAASDPAAA